ncbi:IMPACT family protein [Agrobacterium sp. rho-13.3]|uniref:IMPACT family protein n=1 Tax=Agrobacterium sp. rho-13.3 TaxID=3072980 RepID=UPI002A11F8B8|nr:YigZ family protein [Agrobacterium sp. rho-13.3]MDX8306381.1 YigZ family protein [Agrobacterium sp. rho-13.3]MDX8307288.1 YigZ family protein [Agrobacterium sp. rho-13.3]
MFTLNRLETFSQDIKKSRFIAVAAPVADEDAAKRFIAEHSDATANHNCWAWRVGQTYRFSDDGEPSGTAGKPILQAIDGQSLDCVVVVVTRWFGGVLLGSGGLMRAYGGTAATCLRTAEKTLVIPTISTEIACGFSDLALVKSRLLAVPNLKIETETFTADGATLSLFVPVSDASDVAKMVMDLSNGRVTMPLPD